MKSDCPKKNNKKNELNGIFEGSMYCCKVQEGLSHRDALMNEVNICIPIENLSIDNTKLEVEEEIQVGTSKMEIKITSNAIERTNLNFNETIKAVKETNEINESGVHEPATLTARERLALVLHEELRRMDEEYEPIDIGNGYFQSELEEDVFEINSY